MIVENIINRKYQIVKDFNYTNFGEHTIPRGIIVTVNSIHMSKFGSRVKLQVMRNKNVVEDCYDGIDKKYYINEHNWVGHGLTKCYVTHWLRGKVANEFLSGEFVEDFTKEYIELNQMKEQ